MMRSGSKLKILITTALLVSCLGPGTNSAHQENEGVKDDPVQKPYRELKFNTLIYPYMRNGHTTFLDMIFNPLFDELRKQSKGSLIPNYYVWNELTPIPEIYNSVLSGKADMAFNVVLDSDREQLPVSRLFMIPRVDRFTSKPAEIAWQMLQEWPEMQREWKDVKVLFMFDEHDGGIATTTKPIHSVDDLKGLKLLCLSELAAKQVEALGAVAVMETSSIEAMVGLLKSGAVDGIVHNLPGFLADYGFAPYLKYSVDLRVGSFFAYTVMNRNVWNSLSAEQQTAINTVFNKDAFTLSDRAMARMNANNYRRLDEQFGVKRLTMAATEKAVAAKLLRPVREEYAKFLDNKGYNGKDLLQRFDRLYQENRH